MGLYSVRFKDRHDAGRKLASLLSEFKDDKEAIVIALPRGGVVLGYEVARSLNLPLDIVSPRKLGAPFNPEFAIGAITETGEHIFTTAPASLGLSSETVQNLIEKEKKEALLRLKKFRKNRPPRNLSSKKVILVDDGLATGSTMLAAIKTVKKEKAKQIIVAVPVSPPDTLQRIQKEVDIVVCLSTPSSFMAVGQFYDFFEQTEDDEVISLLEALDATKTL